MGQILKLTKRVMKVIGSKSGRVVVQSMELKKYIGKEVVIRIAIN